MRLWLFVLLCGLASGLTIAPAAQPLSARELLGQVTNCNAVVNPRCENPTPIPASAAGALMQVPTSTPVSPAAPPATSTPTLPPGQARVTAVSPTTASAVAQTPVMVTGVGFTPGSIVLVNERPVQTAYISPTSLTAFIPPGLPAGPYSVAVQNPGSVPSPPLANAFTIEGLEHTLFVPIAAKLGAGHGTVLHVQNVSNAATTVYVLYYDGNGRTEPAWTQTANILPGASVAFDASANAALPTGFDGSAVVQSAEPVTAVVTRVNLAGTMILTDGDVHAAQANASSGALPAFSSGIANQMTIPVTFGGYRSYRTTISIQNTGTVPGSYTVVLYPTGMTTPVATIPQLIQPMAAARVRLSQDLGVPADFIGTAVVTGSAGATLVAAAETLNESNRLLMSYAGFSAGANVVHTPLLFKNYNGWVSGAQVVNMSVGTITVNASIYQRDSAISFGLGTRTLLPNESYTYYLPAVAELPERFVGSGVFTASGPIAVVVQEIHEERAAGMAYTGFGGGTSTISVPVIAKNWNNWDTGIQVQNLGASDAVVNVTYHLPGGQTEVEAALIPVGSSETFYQPANPTLPPGTIGAAMVTAPGGQPIVAIVNQVNYAVPGDGSMVYEGINR